MMKTEVVVVGAGGFARELMGYLMHERTLGHHNHIEITGIVDDSEDRYAAFSNYYSIPYLGSATHFSLRESQMLLVAIGSQPYRRQAFQHFAAKGAKFFTFISSLAYINPTAKIGYGVVIAPFCIVNHNVKLGDYGMLNSYSAIGHDSTVGRHCILYPYAAINGYCTVGDGLMMGTRATIFPGTKVGDNCTITSHSYVKTEKGNNRFIHMKAKEVDLENRL